ncbi:hypothetical protein ACHAXR_003456, partial [Thalassiosira sp. AJA248-18]
MAKTKSNRRNGGAKQRGNWSNADHGERTAKRIASLNKKRRRQQEQEEQADGGDGDQQQQRDHHANANKQQPSNTPTNTTTTNTTSRPHHDLPLHQIRLTKKAHRNKHNRLAYQVPDDAYKRSHLAHDNYDQIDSSKLRLATANIQRKVNALKERLECWDPTHEEIQSQQQQQQQEDKSSIDYKMKLHAANRLMDRTARQKAQSEYNLLHAKHGVNSSHHRRKANLKKKPRPGPESWKLRGAARPAWEVYDFDTRYVDVHMKARDEANEKARRSKNVLSLCRGRFALLNDDDDDGDDVPQPHCRQYLSLLTQLGSLQLHRKNYSSARKSFIEAIELEGHHHAHSITNARYQLMNMYLSTNRPSSARKLWNLLESDGSAWIKYSAALIEYVSWNVLHEEGSTVASAERLLTQAIRGNVYVAYFLGWPQMFERAMEYTHEVVDRGLDNASAGDGAGAAEEDEEDSMDRGMGMWLQTEGSLDWVRSVVLKVLNNQTPSQHHDEKNEEDQLNTADLLSWETKLSKEEEEFERERNEKETAKRLRDEQHQQEQEEEQQEQQEDGASDDNSDNYGNT